MKKELRKKILKTTFEILATPIDLILSLLWLGMETMGGNYTMGELLGKMDRLLLQEKDRIVRNAIYRARKENWIEKDFKLTEEGNSSLLGLVSNRIRIKNFLVRKTKEALDFPRSLLFL